jgi:hypothetical protein
LGRPNNGWPDALPPIVVKWPLLESSPSEKQGPEAEHLRLEFERLRLDRQRLAIETRLKRQELRQSGSKAFKDLLANPFSLAILGGFITIMTSIVTSSNTARENRVADENRATLAAQTADENRKSGDRQVKQALEAELVKKFAEAPTKETVRANLTFLVEANLIPDYAEGIRSFLNKSPDAALPNLAAALVKDATSRAAAFRSIRDVLQYAGAPAELLRAELKGLPPQVLITTTTSKTGIDAADAVEKELRDLGVKIVNRESLDPAQINESRVSCYGSDTCKVAKALVPFLRSKGYSLGEADTSNRAEDNSADKAEALYNARVIRIVLLDPS